MSAFEARAVAPEFPRHYIAADAVFDKWTVAEPYFRELAERPVADLPTLEKWLLDVSELESAFEEEGTRRYTAMTCQTDDADRQQRYLDFIENVQPHAEPWRDQIRRKFVDLAPKLPLPKKRYEVLERSLRNAIELYREENIPLLVEDQKLKTEYQAITGAMTVTYDGREQTLQQLARYLEEPDRKVREETWRLGADRWLQDAAKLDELYIKMVQLRHKIARNADCVDFREYMFRAMERFDYTPEDCLRFHAAIEKVCVPAVQQLAAERRRKLGLKTLRPWDMAVDPENRPPLRPFQTDEELAAGCNRIFTSVDPELGRIFDTLRQRDSLDLGSRKGKAPGGYQVNYAEQRLPFIFMNAVGTETDVRTLLHEGGHSFHSWACRNEPLLAYRSAPLEFAEVASMGMEHLALPYTREFFADEAGRAAKRFFERNVAFFPFMATIDAFQHFVYTHVGSVANGDKKVGAVADGDKGKVGAVADGDVLADAHAALETWKGEYVRLGQRFMGEVDMTGLEPHLRAGWQKKLHVFEVPFYYVEYGIAQLGAMQVWKNSLADYTQAVALYRQGLALGGARPLPELFTAAGLNFDFTESTLRPLIDAAMEKIATL